MSELGINTPSFPPRDGTAVVVWLRDPKGKQLLLEPPMEGTYHPSTRSDDWELDVYPGVRCLIEHDRIAGWLTMNEGTERMLADMEQQRFEQRVLEMAKLLMAVAREAKVLLALARERRREAP